jgi:hypothetical protein
MSNELQSTIALAIVQLDKTKRDLVDIFAWASHPRMITPEDRSRHGMALALARTSLPVIDSSLCRAFKTITGHEPPAMGDWPKLGVETVDPASTRTSNGDDPASDPNSDKKD